MTKQDSIIEREIEKAIPMLGVGGDDFESALQDKVRKRLAARATLGDLTPTYVCPAGHKTRWIEVLVIVAVERGARKPLVFVQCPQCVDVDEMKESPFDWVEDEKKFIKPQLAWINKAANKRLVEIEDDLKSASADEKRSLLKEQKIVKSIEGRTTIDD